MKQLLNGTQARFGEYSMRGKPALHLTIAVVVLYAKGKRGMHGTLKLGYVVDGIDWDPRKIHEICRSRLRSSRRPGCAPR